MPRRGRKQASKPAVGSGQWAPSFRIPTAPAARTPGPSPTTRAATGTHSSRSYTGARLGSPCFAEGGTQPRAPQDLHRVLQRLGEHLQRDRPHCLVHRISSEHVCALQGSRAWGERVDLSDLCLSVFLFLRGRSELGVFTGSKVRGAPWDKKGRMVFVHSYVPGLLASLLMLAPAPPIPVCQQFQGTQEGFRFDGEGVFHFPDGEGRCCVLCRAPCVLPFPTTPPPSTHSVGRFPCTATCRQGASTRVSSNSVTSTARWVAVWH
jgi:hypothetical protein